MLISLASLGFANNEVILQKLKNKNIRAKTYIGPNDKYELDANEVYEQVADVHSTINDLIARELLSLSDILSNQFLIVSPSRQLNFYFYYGQVYLQLNSTATKGIGNIANSNKTPYGAHVIEEKIGEGAPLNAVFRDRVWNGDIWDPTQRNDEDLILTRVLWLKGLERGVNLGGNVDSYRRFIYFHSTNEPEQIGQPASHGCIRMFNEDILDMFGRIAEGTLVYIMRT